MQKTAGKDQYQK